MKVILTCEVPKLGQAGEVVNVKDGYARNFLFPRKFARPATSAGIKWLEQHKKRLDKLKEKKKEELEELAGRLRTSSCTIPMSAGEEDKLFGAVTAEQIAQAYRNEGIEIDKKQVLISEPIKKLGVYQVDIKIHPEIVANVKVWVVKA